MFPSIVSHCISFRAEAGDFIISHLEWFVRLISKFSSNYNQYFSSVLNNKNLNAKSPSISQIQV